MQNFVYEDNLKSVRLLTRKLNPDDALTWADFFKDKDAAEFIPAAFGLTSNEDRAKLWMERQLSRYSENRLGLQALIDKSNNEMIGQCGLLVQEVDGKAEIEVGYHIFKKHWGKGYAPEAARLFIDYAFKNKLTTSVISIIATANIKSQRVAEKNGLVREKQTTFGGFDVFIYRIKKSAFK